MTAPHLNRRSWTLKVSMASTALTACIANTGRWRFQLGRGCSS